MRELYIRKSDGLDIAVVEDGRLVEYLPADEDASAEAISTMVAASAIAATVTTLFIGALSDKIGKRKLFICLGYIAWGVSIFSFVLIREDIIS